jgi:hypothetical protein
MLAFAVAIGICVQLAGCQRKLPPELRYSPQDVETIREEIEKVEWE